MSLKQEKTWRLGWLCLPLALFLGACGSSVDLSRAYEPTPILMPEPLADPAAEEAQPEEVQGLVLPQPVEPVQPQAETLPPMDPAGADGHLVTLTSELDSAQSIPPSVSSAWGHIDLLYDSATRVLRWKASWSGLSSEIVGVQFHGPAQSTEVAPVAMTWPGPFGARYEGRATLTPEQADELLRGHWYLNVLTRARPTGEIRGQLTVVR